MKTANAHTARFNILGCLPGGGTLSEKFRRRWLAMGLSVTGALFLAASAQADFSSPYSNGIGLNFTAGGDGLVADSVAAGYAGPTSFAGSAPLAAIQSQTHWNNVIGIGADVLIGGKDATNASLLNTFRVTTAGGWLGSSGLYDVVDTTGAVGTIYRDALAGGANVWDDVFTPLAAVTVTGIPYQNYDVAILTSWLGQDDLSWWLLTPTGNLGIRQGDNGASHGAFNGPTFSWSVDSDQSKGAIFALQILNKETPSLKWIGNSSAWGTSSNWTTGAVPLSTDSPIFGSTTTIVATGLTSDLGASNRQLAGMVFAAVNAMTIDSSQIDGGTLLPYTLTLSGSPSATVEVQGNSHTITAPLVLGSDLTIQATAGSLTLGAVSDAGTSTVTKTGPGTLNLNGTQAYNTLAANGGTTNVNGLLGVTPGAAVVSVGAGASLKFGSVSQTLSSLSIAAGGTVVFTSGVASFGGGGKAAGFGGSAVVPEPGTMGLLLVGALGVLNRRRQV